MDYFNDFQRVVRSDDISAVIDRYRLKQGRDCTDTETRRAMRDVLSVIDAMKLCRRDSYPHIIKLARFCASFTPTQCALFFHVIGGGTLSEYAISEGVSEQAAHQMWCRIVRKNPELDGIHKRRHVNGTRQPLENRLGAGA